MGNCGEKPTRVPLNVQLEEEYKKLGLPEVDQNVLTSELEREVYIAVNLVRHNPSRMARVINPKLGENTLMTKEGKKALPAVQKYLEKADELAPLAVEPRLMQICMEVNDEILGKEKMNKELEADEAEEKKTDKEKKKEKKETPDEPKKKTKEELEAAEM